MSATAVPWYRFFWPWFIIALLSAAVAGSLVSAYLAVNTTDTVLEHSDQAG
ncbi:MAG: FixH family protein [Proteobacteria bacterium]|nr:FixH family protein [Pseudomonadota bacterium]